MTHRSTLAASLLALLSIGSLAACSKPAPKASAPAHRQITATVTTVALSPVAQRFTLSGTQVSREEAAVSTELSGYRISKVLVEAGALVSAGQPLVLLDSTLLNGQIDQQKAIVAQQTVAYEKANAEAKRVENLDKLGVLSTETVNERVLNAQSAKASLDQAQALLKDYQVRLDLMTIRAPVAGTVLKRTARPGDVASPSTVLFTIARDNLVELEAQVPEAQLASILIGQVATVALPGGKSLNGHARLVSPDVDATTKLGTIRIALPEDSDLKPGGFGEASLEGAAANSRVVPTSAVIYNADGASLFVLGKDNVLERKMVRTGTVSGDLVELLQGPDAGTRIVAKGGAMLLPGDHINPAAAPGVL